MAAKKHHKKPAKKRHHKTLGRDSKGRFKRK